MAKGQQKKSRELLLAQGGQGAEAQRQPAQHQARRDQGSGEHEELLRRIGGWADGSAASCPSTMLRTSPSPEGEDFAQKKGLPDRRKALLVERSGRDRRVRRGRRGPVHPGPARVAARWSGPPCSLRLQAAGTAAGGRLGLPRRIAARCLLPAAADAFLPRGAGLALGRVIAAALGRASRFRAGRRQTRPRRPSPRRPRRNAARLPDCGGSRSGPARQRRPPPPEALLPD